MEKQTNRQTTVKKALAQCRETELPIKAPMPELNNLSNKVVRSPHIDSPGKSCKSSLSGKFRILQCPQNSVIRDEGQRETCASNLGVA